MPPRSEEKAPKPSGGVVLLSENDGNVARQTQAQKLNTLNHKYLVRVESRATWSGIVAAVLAGGFAFLAFQGYRPPLSGDNSVAVYAAILSAIASALAFFMGFLFATQQALKWLSERPLPRRVLDALALMAMHGSIAMMGSLALFRMFQASFVGLTVDAIAGSAMVAGAAAMAAYLSYSSGAKISTASLSVLLASYIAAGVVVSMLYAENPFWWHSMFSELGTGQASATSYWTFNTTLVTSGILLALLADFITRELKDWSEVKRLAKRELIDFSSALPVRFLRRMETRFVRPRVSIVRGCLIGIGVCLVGIGLAPVHTMTDLHTAFEWVAAFLIVFMMLGVPVWMPYFPGAFYIMSFGAVLVLVGASYLWFGLGYYNLTALELVAAGVLFGWLVVLIRNIDAVMSEPESEHAE
ncbi:hypothetical protein [Neomicrococcus lactis]|uniref:hypothetical protein n=1 Tax=Neomicrococcus lactis TaxID=732241 RepID=UPI0023012CDE|nr:hypothetical protein [Neomicrococcus lactis]